MGRAFAIGVTLNTAFVLAEAGAGLWSGSLALLADAGHNLSDVLALLLAWGATILAKRAPSGRRTYGMRKGTILASLANAVLLVLAVGVIAAESVRKFSDPVPIDTQLVMLIAGLGVVINTATALLFLRGQGDINVRGAFLHMVADAAVSLGVVVGAAIIAATGLLWIDPLLGLLIALVIVIGAWGLLRDSVNLAMDAAPRGIDVDKVRAWLTTLPGVEEVHDLHIWAMSTTEIALTAHLVRPAGAGDNDHFLHDACAHLAREFHIGHTTLQIERGGGVNACALSSPESV